MIPLNIPPHWTARGKKHFIWRYVIPRHGIPMSVLATLVVHLGVLGASFHGRDLYMFISTLVVNMLVVGPIGGWVVGHFLWHFNKNLR